MNVEKKIAKNLLDIKAVSLRPNEPFTWASGIKSPIYCDNRLVLSYPEKRTAVVEGFVELIRNLNGNGNCRNFLGSSCCG